MPKPKTENDYSTPIENDLDRIKWPVRAPFGFYGAKTRISKKIIEQLPPHNCWVELFCGSAALTMAKQPAPIEIINDIDSRIINFFEQLRKHQQKLCEAIALTPYARSEYENYFRDEQADFRDLEEFEAWVRIGNQNSLVKTYPPPKPEIDEIPKADKLSEIALTEKTKINLLRDCWFSC